MFENDLVLNILGFQSGLKVINYTSLQQGGEASTFLLCGEHIKLVVIFISYSQGSFQFIKNKHSLGVALHSTR